MPTTDETPPGSRDSGARWPLYCYLTGQGVSLLGDEAYYVALAWAATLAGGPAGVALVTSIAALPRAVLMLPGERSRTGWGCAGSCWPVTRSGR